MAINRAEQLTLVCYTCVYLRYMRDGSLVLALVAWACVSLAEFLGGLLTVHLRRTVEIGQEDHGLEPHVVKAVLRKGLVYFRWLLFGQTAWLAVCHSRPNASERYHGIVMPLIGDLDGSQRSLWGLWLLDVAVTLLQLALLHRQLQPQVKAHRLTVPQLEANRYGILAPLRLDIRESEDELDLLISSRVSPGNDYGSLSSASLAHLEG